MTRATPTLEDKHVQPKQITGAQEFRAILSNIVSPCLKREKEYGLYRLYL